ncbi:hypothetical protein D3C76_1420780 [compost metagenome]
MPGSIITTENLLNVSDGSLYVVPQQQLDLVLGDVALHRVDQRGVVNTTSEVMQLPVHFFAIQVLRHTPKRRNPYPTRDQHRTVLAFSKGEQVSWLTDLQPVPRTQAFVNHDRSTTTFRIFGYRYDVTISLGRIVQQGVTTQRNTLCNDVNVRPWSKCRKRHTLQPF